MPPKRNLTKIVRIKPKKGAGRPKPQKKKGGCPYCN